MNKKGRLLILVYTNIYTFRDNFDFQGFKASMKENDEVYILLEGLGEKKEMKLIEINLKGRFKNVNIFFIDCKLKTIILEKYIDFMKDLKSKYNNSEIIILCDRTTGPIFNILSIIFDRARKKLVIAYPITTPLNIRLSCYKDRGRLEPKGQYKTLYDNYTIMTLLSSTEDEFNNDFDKRKIDLLYTSERIWALYHSSYYKNLSVYYFEPDPTKISPYTKKENDLLVLIDSLFNKDSYLILAKDIVNIIKSNKEIKNIQIRTHPKSKRPNHFIELEKQFGLLKDMDVRPNEEPQRSLSEQAAEYKYVLAYPSGALSVLKNSCIIEKTYVSNSYHVDISREQHLTGSNVPEIGKLIPYPSKTFNPKIIYSDGFIGSHTGEAIIERLGNPKAKEMRLRDIIENSFNYN